MQYDEKEEVDGEGAEELDGEGGDGREPLDPQLVHIRKGIRNNVRRVLPSWVVCFFWGGHVL